MAGSPNFSQWLAEYDKFKQSIKPILTTELSTEISELTAENQALPRFAFAAGEHKAMAAMFYAQLKETNLKAQVIWAKTDSAGVLDAIKARSIAVSVAMRPE